MGQYELTVVERAVRHALDVGAPGLGDGVKAAIVSSVGRRLVGQLNIQVKRPGDHIWVPSKLGHGEMMCSRCSITNREAAVLGLLDQCEPANTNTGTQPASGAAADPAADADVAARPAAPTTEEAR